MADTAGDLRRHVLMLEKEVMMLREKIRHFVDGTKATHHDERQVPPNLGMPNQREESTKGMPKYHGTPAQRKVEGHGVEHVFVTAEFLRAPG